MQESRAVPGQNRFLAKTGCCRAVLDRIDSWNRESTAEQSRAVPRQNRFPKQRECCRTDQLLDRLGSCERRDTEKQRNSWIVQIPGKHRILQNRAIPGQYRMLQSRADPGQNRFLEKTGCCREGQFLDRNIFLEKTGFYRAEQFLDRNIFLEKTGCYRAEQVVEQSNMWKGENNSFTFNKFFFYKNGSEPLCTVC